LNNARRLVDKLWAYCNVLRDDGVPTIDYAELLDADGDELENTYRHILERLGRQTGTLGVVFRKAQNKIQDLAKLKRLVVDLIGKEHWSLTE